MQLEYRFSLTPRLIAVGLFSLVALFVLLFLMGIQVGQRWARSEYAASPAGASAAATDAEKAVAGAQKKAAEAESLVKKVSEPPALPAVPGAKP